MGVQLSKTSHQIIFILILPIISIIFTYLINVFLQKYITYPWVFLIDSVGVLGMYSLLFQLFNYSLWQLFPVGVLQIVDVPNLNGTWTGELRSSYDKNTTPYEVRVEVVQTFSSVKVYSYFDRSWSFSIVSDFYKEADGRMVLHYVYRNEPRNNASPTMHGHYGAAKHEYLPEKEIMECSYYNEPPRDRGWYGRYNVKRRKRSLLELLFPSLRNKLG